MRRIWARLLAGVALGLALWALAACAPLRGEITINPVGKAVGYDLALFRWSGEKRLEMLLEAGEELQVEVAWEQGEAALAILGQKGEEAYRGKLPAAGLFTVKVAKQGLYGIELKGNRATGRVLIRSVGNGR